jgi:pilus assembly protein Flp/PilA
MMVRRFRTIRRNRKLIYYGGVNWMRKFLGTLKKFGKDEEGAALVEYAVLLGILLAATITIIGTLGGQITAIFTTLSGLLPAA